MEACNFFARWAYWTSETVNLPTPNKSPPMSSTHDICVPKRIFALLAVFFVGAASSQAQTTVTHGSSDANGVSGFTDGTRWSDGLVPHSGAVYTTSTLVRTPADAVNHAFGGDALTILNNGSVAFKGTANAVITINNLNIRTGGFVTNNQGAPTFTLAGSLAINSGNTANLRLAYDGTSGTPQSAGFSVSSAVSGAGMLSISTTNPNQATVAVTLTGAANTYSGGTSVLQNSWLIAQADGTLGAGNLSVTGAQLTLQAGGTNNYIADTATVAFSALRANAINLNYLGSDVVGGISLDGGTTFLGAGDYSATTLNTLYGSNAFTGNGSLTVVPEPSQTTMIAGAALLMLVTVRLARRNRMKAC